MMMPMLSEADLSESAEGSIDPLGLYPIADLLAQRMVPGVRERQRHPRFLTLIASSLSLCSEFDEERVAVDGVSEPWQVFEWYVVEGLARATTDKALLRGLPGRDKADKARVVDQVPLSARNYLKGPLESEAIRSALVSRETQKIDAGHRGEIFAALTSDSGQSVWLAELQNEEPSERRFHNWLIENATPPLARLLEAIAAYERFARLLQNAFDDCLRYMVKHPVRVKHVELAELPTVKLASAGAAEAYTNVNHTFASIGVADRFHQSFSDFAEPASPLDWAILLTNFHAHIQRNKPPNGKAAWFDRFDDGSFLIRPGYRREFESRPADEYVHAYRTHSLWSFACDLNSVDRGVSLG